MFGAFRFAAAIRRQVVSHRWQTVGAISFLSMGFLSTQFCSPMVCCEAKREGEDRMEPITKRLIPSSMKLQDTWYALMAVGVRQVTLFNFSVYTIGLYASERSLSLLKTRRWKEMLDAPTYLKNGDDMVNELVSSDEIHLAMRIETTRPTNGQHLRKGFLKLLNHRHGHVKSVLSEEENAVRCLIILMRVRERLISE